MKKNHAFFFVELIENRKGRIIFVAEEFVEGVKSEKYALLCDLYLSISFSPNKSV